MNASPLPQAAPDNVPGTSLLVHPANQPPARLHTGVANLELAVPISETTAFNVGSIGKQITAHLVLLSARRGQLALDQQAAHFLPRLRVPGVTVGDLLLHHGGIRDAETLLSLAGFRDQDHYTASDLLELAYRQTQRAVPIGRFLYSNTGYLLLAEILQVIHSTGLDHIARGTLFAPLGMSTARFKSDPAQVIPGAAASYRNTTRGWEHCSRPVALPGPGSLWCTPTDLDRWLAHVHQQWRGQPRDLPFAGDLAYQSSDHEPYLYGPGLYADPRPATTAVFHYGHEHGFSAAAYLTDSGLRVISLSNDASTAADQIAAAVLTAVRSDPRQDLARLLALVSDTSIATSSATVQPAGETDDDPPHTMLGTYTCDQVPGRLRLSRKDGDLYLWRRGTRDRLIRTGTSTYACDGYTLTLPSGEDGARRVDGFVLDLDRAPGLRYRAG